MKCPTQEDIPETLKELRKALGALQNEETFLRSQIKGIQEICKHPKTYSGNTWGRWAYTQCEICGKEW